MDQVNGKQNASDMTTLSTLYRGTLVFNSMHHIALKLASNIEAEKTYVFRQFCLNIISIPQIHQVQ